MHSFYIIFFLNQGQQFFYIYLHNKLILPCLRKEQYFQKMKICEGLNDIKWSEYIKIAKKKKSTTLIKSRVRSVDEEVLRYILFTLHNLLKCRAFKLPEGR